MHDRKINGQRGGWIGQSGKAMELRVMFVALRRTTQNFLRQQHLVPECDKFFGVEILWMQRPESHFTLTISDLMQVPGKMCSVGRPA